MNRPRYILQAIILICLIAATLAVYWRVQDHDFLYYDDDDYILENPHVRTGLKIENITWAFKTFYDSNWHPITWLSHMLDCHLYGLNSKGHHFNNLLFHIANSLLLFLVLQRATGTLWRGALVAALFALHPLHVESVAWVAERKDVLSTFFWMLTLLCYIHYAEHPKPKRYFFVILFFALGLMAKPTLVTLPFVLLLLDYWPLGRIQFFHTDDNRSSQVSKNINFPIKRPLFLVYEKLPLFLFSGILSFITFYAQKQHGTVISLELLPLQDRISNAIVSYVIYIGKMIFPSNLAIFYPHPGTIPGWKVIGAALLLLCISLLAVRKSRRYPHLIVGWLWFLGTMMPMIGLVQVGSQAMADRYTYIPYIGLFLMVSWSAPYFLSKWHYQRHIIFVMAGLSVSALIICTWSQIKHWENSIRIFEQALRVTENNHLAHYNLGTLLHKQGELEKAVAHYSRALQIKPDMLEAHYNLGVALTQTGRSNEAITHYSEALKLEPRHEKAHNDLGVALAMQGKTKEAISHFSEALRIRPDYQAAYNNLTVALQGVKEFNNPHKLEPP